MKLGWLLGLGALLTAAGCEPKVETPVATAPPEKPPVGAPNHASANTPTNSAPNAPNPTATTSGTAGNALSDPNDPEYSRVNHLKDLKTITVSLAGKPHRLWIMDDEGKRQEGMMFLTEKEVAPDQGMVFVFKYRQRDDGRHGFWMDNCPLGLDIIYIKADKTVLKVGDGVPFNKTPVPPGGDYDWVVELRRGRAKEIGLKPGMKIALPDSLKANATETPPPGSDATS